MLGALVTQGLPNFFIITLKAQSFVLFRKVSTIVLGLLLSSHAPHSAPASAPQTTSSPNDDQGCMGGSCPDSCVCSHQGCG